MKKITPLAALVLLAVVAAVLVAAPQSVSADAPPDVPTVHSSFVLESQWDFEAYVGGPEPRQVYINGQLTSLAMCGYCYHMTMQPGETRDVQVLVNWPNMHSHWFNYRVGAFEGPGTIRANLDGIVVPVVEVQTNFENRWAVTWYVDSNPHPDLAGAVRYYVIDGGRDGGVDIAAVDGFEIYRIDEVSNVWVPIEESLVIETFETIAVARAQTTHRMFLPLILGPSLQGPDLEAYLTDPTGGTCWSGPLMTNSSLPGGMSVTQCVEFALDHEVRLNLYWSQARLTASGGQYVALWSHSGGTIRARYANGVICEGLGVQLVADQWVTLTFSPAAPGETFGQGGGSIRPECNPG